MTDNYCSLCKKKGHNKNNRKYHPIILRESDDENSGSDSDKFEDLDYEYEYKINTKDSDIWCKDGVCIKVPKNMKFPKK